MSDAIELVHALEQPNVRPFLWMLRLGEGTQGPDGYRTLFGGELFDDLSRHPNRRVTRNGITSTAAGAYQGLFRTWSEIAQQWGLADFEPATQDLFAVALLMRRKALQDVIAGRFEAAVAKCNREWASLPGSPYGQPTVTLARARACYEEAGGMVQPAADVVATGPAAAAPRPFVSDSTPTKDSAMTPLLLALPALLDLVPKLGALFSSGSAMSTRNLEAAQVVVDVAKQAIGARNEQELAEMIKADPESAEAVRQAVEANWFKIDEIGGGIAAARAANDKMSAPGALPFFRQPAFVITLLLVPLVYFVTVYTLAFGEFADEVKSMVVASIISGLLTGITGFWLGTSFSSQRKTDMMAAPGR